MESNTTYYTELISRYYYGEATPEEILELEHWVKADPANASTFREFQKSWKMVEDDRISNEHVVDEEWGRVRRRIKDQRSMIKDQKLGVARWVLRLAAVVIILVVPSFFLYRYFNQTSDNQLTADVDVTEHMLPDGTLVVLNVGSTLSFPDRFDGSFRRVTLQGEGWFEVAHNTSKPFIVESENARIRVVGTKFFMDTRQLDGSKEVILEEGMVRVYFESQSGHSTLLVPGERAIVSSEKGTIDKSLNDDVNFLAWRTRHLVFNNTPLEEVTRLLTQVYHLQVRITSDEIRHCTITATFDRQSIESVLNVLKATLGLHISKSGNGFEISGSNCDSGK